MTRAPSPEPPSPEPPSPEPPSETSSPRPRRAGADPGLAPAKVNLALHVTGRRGDGYHLLDGLVVFADLGDRVEAAPAEGLSLAVSGPFAAEVPVEGNLVLRAAEALRAARGVGTGAAITLEKALPAASGVGGGSSDAAASVRVLARLWGVAPLAPVEGLALGADVPVCLLARPARMRGVGEVLEPAPPLPPSALVLANPGVPSPTGPVFAGLEGFGAPTGPVPAALDHDGLVRWLAARRNDLEAPAGRLVPAVPAVLGRLGAAPGVDLARMSGSGATCFGLCRDLAAAERAARAVARAEPGWWVRAAPLLA